MEIEWQDFNEIVLNECNNVKQHAQELESLLADYCYDTPLRSKIDRTLVKLSITSQKLMDLVMPIPSTGEIFGLPRESTSNADLPKPILVHKDRTGWDYMPWFCEKVTRIRQAVNRLMQELEKNPEEIEINSTFWNSPVDYIKDGIELQLDEMRHVNDALLTLFKSGELSIGDVEIIDED